MLLIFMHVYGLTLSPYSDLSYKHMKSLLDFGSLLYLKMGDSVMVSEGDIMVSGAIAQIKEGAEPIDLSKYTHLDSQNQRLQF